MSALGRGGTRSPPRPAPGWRLEALAGPSVLHGANGMRVGPDGRLYVAQAFGSQVSAIDLDRGAVETISPPEGPIVGPDDLAFDSHGRMYVTEVMSARVSVRDPDGTVRVLAADLPSANGITVHDDRVFVDEHRRGGRLFELYADGSRPPRLICGDLLGPNALMMGPDGKLYLPLVPLGEVWRVDVRSGAKEKVAEGLAAPTAVKFSPGGDLIVPQARTGEIVRIDVGSGARTLVARTRPGIDNLAFTPDGRMFVSHFVDGGIDEVPLGGGRGPRTLVPPGLVGPWGLAWDGSRLLVADGLSLGVLGPDGAVARLGGILDEGFPGFIRGIAPAAAGELLLTTARGDVVRHRPADGRTGAAFTTVAKRLEPLGGVAAMGEAVVAVATESGRLLRIGADGAIVAVAEGLSAPSDVVIGPGGRPLVSETGAGRVVAVDPGGGHAPLVEGLSAPKGLALAGGSLWVLDVGARELLQLDLRSGEQRVVASELPVAAIGPMTFPGGIATDGAGMVHVAGSADGSVLALRQGG